MASGMPMAAHSTTRALYAAYAGPLYQVMRNFGAPNNATFDVPLLAPGASDNSIAVLVHHYGPVVNGRIMSHAPGMALLLELGGAAALSTAGAAAWRGSAAQGAAALLLSCLLARTGTPLLPLPALPPCPAALPCCPAHPHARVIHAPTAAQGRLCTRRRRRRREYV